MAKYRKKISNSVEAFQYGINDVPMWFLILVRKGKIFLSEDAAGGVINIPEASSDFKTGDWIVKEDNGDICVYQNDEFLKTYELETSPWEIGTDGTGFERMIIPAASPTSGDPLPKPFTITCEANASSTI